MLYWYIYYSSKDSVVTITPIHTNDNYLDFGREKFYFKEDGEPYRFTEFEDAKRFLNDTFDRSIVDPQYQLIATNEYFQDYLRKCDDCSDC